jgi:predicted nucleotidyltransferase component of viral defense system
MSPKRQVRNVAASVRDRLLAVARERGEDFQFVLTRYVVERLLYRLSISRYREQFLLKGAMLFLVWTGEVYRPTRDLDLLGRGRNEIEVMERVFREICGVEVDDDGLRFVDVPRGERIREEEDYEGVRLTMTAALGEARIPLQVDIAFGDAVHPAPAEAEFPVLLGQPAPRVRVYPPEAVVAEKFQIMVRLGIANSRMKDFADVWTLATTRKFQGQTLARAIAATFERRRTPIPTEPPLALSAEFAEDRAKQAQWRAFVARTRLARAEHKLGEVIGLLRDFLMPPAAAAAEGRRFRSLWSASGPWQSVGRGRR